MTILVGMDGVPGSDGRDGPEGRDGEKGVQGPQGERGSIGAEGEQGKPGLIGDHGPAGPQGRQGSLGPTSEWGAVYTRWGRTSCIRGIGTELVYKGRAGGSWYNDRNGAANYLCLPDEPVYLEYLAGRQGESVVHGAEYESYNGPHRALQDHNVPCAVCYVATRGSELMMPATTYCPHTWTREYYGYLMTLGREHNDNVYHSTMFECVDVNAELLPGGRGDQNGALFQHTEASCSALPCPPYDAKKELACAVCTK